MHHTHSNHDTYIAIVRVPAKVMSMSTQTVCVQIQYRCEGTLIIKRRVQMHESTQHARTKFPQTCATSKKTLQGWEFLQISDAHHNITARQWVITTDHFPTVNDAVPPREGRVSPAPLRLTRFLPYSNGGHHSRSYVHVLVILRKAADSTQ